MKTDLTTQNAGVPAEGPHGARYPVVPDDVRRGVSSAANQDNESVPWGRYMRALWRYKFLVAFAFAIGVFAAYKVAKSIPVEYIARA